MSCGITEEEIREQLTLKEQISKLDLSKCKRCDGQPFVQLQKQHIFCKVCFKEYCEHKFRSTIGKTRMIKPHHRVLIAYSGGQSSTAMLDLALSSLRNESFTQRWLMKNAVLLYIDGEFKEYNPISHLLITC